MLKLSACLFLATIGFSATASASIACVGIPDATKVGDFGAQEAFLIVTIGGKDYRLGLADDAWAKARLSQANTALATNKRLLMLFYDPVFTCDKASSDRVVPNSVQLLQQ